MNSSTYQEMLRTMMLSHASLVEQLRPLIHPMLVHFPIALIFASVALDWSGFWLNHPNLTRAGFYTLVLGALGAGFAALTGPDHATGDASVPGLLAMHQNFASLTVGLAVVMVAARFLAPNGVRGMAALVYLLATLALLFAVSATGYYGGEMAYHHAVGISTPAGSVDLPSAVDNAVRPLIPAKPFTALVGFLAVVGLGCWLTLGRTVFGAFYAVWWRAVRRELANANAPLWTLQRRPAATQHAQPQSSMSFETPDQISTSRL